ncbi:hypothetical protein KOI35_39360 [Actinoplanes bogorensis]|uniref:Uncharacterized protein n=1 Tax=Paractinoplanes bogorensis TaxID=1610840 RepID=A0ABS5Z238_9ACTN|nr:hypothetical protein [Actinoplanes bogorensis]MBU2669586.1 hypothetical protein [Actinoplanes bogorensis]
MDLHFQRAVAWAVLGASAIFTSAAALVATSRPAYADEATADLEVKVSATTAITGELFRRLELSVLNNGPSDVPRSWTLVFDFSGLNDRKVTVVPVQLPDCVLSDDKMVCTETLGIPVESGHFRTMPFNLDARPGVQGPVGSFTITADSSSVPDPNPGNNTATIDVRAAEPSTPPTTPPTTPPVPGDERYCEAYLYTGTRTNLCADFRGAHNPTCDAVKYQVTLPDYRNDPWGLDGPAGAKFTGVRGLGCENNPRKPAPTSSAPPPGGGGGGGGAGGLPVTGADVPMAAGFGLALLTIGAGAVLLVRRRARRFEP